MRSATRQRDLAYAAGTEERRRREAEVRQTNPAGIGYGNGQHGAPRVGKPPTVLHRGAATWPGTISPRHGPATRANYAHTQRRSAALREASCSRSPSPPPVTGPRRHLGADVPDPWRSIACLLPMPFLSFNRVAEQLAGYE